LIWLTGGIHIDGFGDTIDGLAGGKTKEEILNIMKDSHIGVMGVLGIISLLSLKLCFLCEIPEQLKNHTLLLMPLMGRWSIVIGCCLAPYARVEGTGKAFVTYVGAKELFIGTAITIVVTLLLIGWQGMLLTFIIPLFALIWIKYLRMKIGGITGDTLGALCEVSEIITLLSMIILSKIGI
jgi:adenosylcobinamide-GDP ribazoletransferase